ncbi:MAG: hypothetical protein DSY76_03945 [Bacteroidetes bacterium]|nr:MAG: hypothetical protein DSY76_03945 [Bacteroidota bacterium]
MKRVFKILGLFVLIGMMSFSTNVDKKVVVIDAAHGGNDLGAVADGVFEKDITLRIAQLIKEFNENDDVEIVLLREDDKFLSIKDRLAMINSLKPYLVISLHMNQSTEGGRKSGLQFVTSRKNHFIDQTNEFLKVLLDSRIDELGETVAKEGNFDILSKSNAPAIMIEMGYIDNKDNREFIQSEEGSLRLAQMVLNIIK